MHVKYSSNNSGGDWWLGDKDWKALEDAGWEVAWVANEKGRFARKNSGGRFLGALAMNAKRYGLTLDDAVKEWERVTGACSTDAGCPCCGNPHNFTEYDDKGKWVASGPRAEYVASW